ncbi:MULTISPECIES: hypothetical protein [unclassified Streptomyces]|uniref:hypothetical protein n=1 Tax=unclassified Streptomyces TaxID=2593676 RepID=UPI00093E51B4|nr:hypothetical protein [Streptomyces sp. CB02400]OKK11525.1 hypothetical protein AMK33_08865 [Streptomyces sp. CB02400]
MPSVINPDKLGHLGPVADAWALDQEVKQIRSRRIVRHSAGPPEPTVGDPAPIRHGKTQGPDSEELGPF